MNFEFVAYNNRIRVTPNDLPNDDYLDIISELSAAMQIANRELIWDNPEWTDGIWELQEEDINNEIPCQIYYWKTGYAWD